MKTLEKDILLICKGWYSEKYNNVLEAFNAYYHKEYGCENIKMNKRFALELFLRPTIIEMSKYSSSIIINLFNPTCMETDRQYQTDFINVMYNRCLNSITSMRTKGNIDLSEYKEMLNQDWDKKEEKIFII